MSNKIIDRKHVFYLTLLCSLVYFVSYMTRVNYAAVLVEIVAAEGYSKTAVSVALTGLFITYGAGQLISGYLGDRLPPRLIIAGGLGLSAVMNLLIPLCTGTFGMTVVWCVNGFAQAMMWPPLVKILVSMLQAQDYQRASVKVSWGGAFGTMAVYLLAPLLIAISGWRALFYMTSGIAICMTLVWLRGSQALELYAEKNGERAADRSTRLPAGQQPKRGPILSLLGMIILAIILQGVLRDGITTWMPTYIAETFSLKSSAAILTGVALPLFSIVCYQAVAALNRRLVANEVACAAIMYAIGALSCGLLSFAGSVSPALSVILLTVATGCMHGVNVMLICMLPPYFRKTNRVAMISGLLNACTYIGSAISMYGVALVTETAGWPATIGIWTIAALIGTAFCAVGSRGWKRFRMEPR